VLAGVGRALEAEALSELSLNTSSSMEIALLSLVKLLIKFGPFLNVRRVVLLLAGGAGGVPPSPPCWLLSMPLLLITPEEITFAEIYFSFV